MAVWRRLWANEGLLGCQVKRVEGGGLEEIVD